MRHVMFPVPCVEREILIECHKTALGGWPTQAGFA
jgi:hypothetical protein